ncbi:hypothetical protein Pmani_005526 [Petrolisthes manimaculis]|uniref:EGF-like domain-containing protein n=1 Tax=Petrolisthes manimaculis TaxID=1843537 RepID=A0AAE1QC96_9EUCA|nr:hypothetical protein Pmani_005526 [Petrolisthes manimaculis]
MSLCQRDTPCSHLCLIVPGEYKCVCPDNKAVKNSYPTCDAPHETPKPKPLGCGCLNGGMCTPNGTNILLCECRDGYSGELCVTPLYLPGGLVTGHCAHHTCARSSASAIHLLQP